MTTERVDRCPTCGSVVRVISADDDLGGPAVSACYRPMQDEELRETIERLKVSRDYWRRKYITFCERIQGLIGTQRGLEGDSP